MVSRRLGQLMSKGIAFFANVISNVGNRRLELQSLYPNVPFAC